MDGRVTPHGCRGVNSPARRLTFQATHRRISTSPIGAPMRLRRQVQLKLEAEMRNLSMGLLLAEVASMAIKKEMIEEILREPAQERAPPLQREKLIAEPVGLQNFA